MTPICERPSDRHSDSVSCPKTMAKNLDWLLLQSDNPSKHIVSFCVRCLLHVTLWMKESYHCRPSKLEPHLFQSLIVFLSPVTCRNAHPMERVDQSGALPFFPVFGRVPRIPHQAQEHTSELADFQEHDLSGARVSRLFRSCRFHDQYFDQLKRRRGCEKSLFVVDHAPWHEVFWQLARFDTHRNPCQHQPIERQLVFFHFCQSTPASKLLPTVVDPAFGALHELLELFRHFTVSLCGCPKTVLRTNPVGQHQKTQHLLHFFRFSTSNHPQTSSILSQYSWKLMQSMERLPAVPSLPSRPRNHRRRSLLEGPPQHASPRVGRLYNCCQPPRKILGDNIALRRQLEGENREISCLSCFVWQFTIPWLLPKSKDASGRTIVRIPR